MPIFWPDAASVRARRALARLASPPRGRPVPAPRMDAAPARLLAESPANTLAHLAALFSILVLLAPGIDLLVSGWFVGPDGGFPLSGMASLIALRDLNRILTPVLLWGLAALLLAQGLGLRRPALPRPHAVLFVLAFYAAGPGLLVNGLKTLVGRARPRDIAEFGGADLFTPAWQASSACSGNCSFPSGEAGSALAMLALVFLLPPASRRPALYVLVPFVVAVSLNRIAFGAHFFSDVVLSWLLCGAVMLSLRPVFTRRAEALDAAVTGGLARLAARWRRGAAFGARAA
ncbi:MULTISPECIES: phosphatase PAP2 family protein [unclassified Aureimonas]|uniref:phosphatase PAP2 family protein n=1 Tax=unclassified Aureimonas TaxID=2615206 RepID=UPI0006FB4E17|nr:MULTISPECIES: phosphatase PAP2 family protein [unclassified Aureimonas]KQT65785.1 hypothetical protein ASG62_21680 [Aureimonas sp. Leaf427]KQT74784.1 hypothetical protein ASG54_16740 [Aureimonas sp. Leaf460]